MIHKLGVAAVVAGLVFVSAGVAEAIEPPQIDLGATPADGPPGPGQPMRQNAYCTRVGTLPGTDYRVQPHYMDMLDLPEAWRFGRGAGQKVAVIDTGVSPHARFSNLIGGGDYVEAGGDGLADCDAHGTIVASIIAGADGSRPLPPPRERRPDTVPTTEAPPPPPPPQTIVTTVIQPPSPPPAAPPPPPPEAPAEEAPAAWRGGTVTVRPAGRHQQAPPLDEVALPDGFAGIAPDAQLIAIRHISLAFSPKDAFGGEDPNTRRKIQDIHSMARAIVHAANMGATVINISEVQCMSALNVVDQRELGAAIRYAAIDRNAVIVAAAGNAENSECGKQNPLYNALTPTDPRDWQQVNTVVTPAWFSDYVLVVGATDPTGQPLTSSVAGPWVGIAAPGTDVEGFSPRDDGLINAVENHEHSLGAMAGTSFAAAIVSGTAALVRAKYPDLTSHQVINRLIRTAHAPARGVDNQVGHGVIDPVAALTYDVPRGEAMPPEHLASKLVLPKPVPPRDMRPVAVAGAGILGLIVLGAAAIGGAALRRKGQSR